MLGAAGAAMPADDGPSLGALLSTCRAALAADWQGVDAAACAWYLDPCAVCGIDTPAATWCVPAAVTPPVRATQVLGILMQRPEDRTTHAAPLIRQALTQAFPCAAE